MRPKLRYVDIMPVETEHGEMFALRDPLGIAEEVIVVSRAAIYIMQFMDGYRTVEALVEAARASGRLQLEARMVEDLVQHLDAKLFLDNQRFLERKHSIEQELLNAKVRKARFAGVSYPKEPEALRSRLKNLFQEKNGAGLPNTPNGLPAPSAVLAPHIDPRIGGATYTHAWRRIAESEPADVYIILGTGHAGLQDVFSVLPVDFETPLGVVPTDKAFISRLQKNYDFDLFTDAFLHGAEHTIEFQAVFLKNAFPEKNVRIVPVLCSFSFHALTMPQFNREKEIITAFIQSLRTTIQEFDGKITLIASIDLSHVGPRYGDENPIDATFLYEVEQHDRAALEHIISADAEGWLKTNAAVEDRYRICGFSPVYTLLRTCDAQSGEILRYEQGKMDDGFSYVSYCSAVLKE